MRGMKMDFQGMDSGVRRGEERGPSSNVVEARAPSAFGAPSAELSLGGLRPRRARFRFTRRRDDSQDGQQEQGQCQGRW